MIDLVGDSIFFLKKVKEIINELKKESITKKKESSSKNESGVLKFRHQN